MWFNRKQYVYFAILLVLVQSLICCIMLFNHNNNVNEQRFLEDKYYVEDTYSDYYGYHNYHIIMYNLTPNQEAALLSYNAQLQDVEWYFYPIKVERSTQTNRSNVFIYFESRQNPDIQPWNLYKSFTESEFYQDEFSKTDVVIYETPLLSASKSAISNTSASVFICILITALGTITFIILYHTVVNHFKFSFGIYMTFGANFKKLLANALSEMLFINLVTFIPSFLFSLLITYVLTLRAGYGVDLLIYPMFLALLCSLILTFVAVTIVIRKISLDTPNKLIMSVNNESLISSPRVSAAGCVAAGGFPLKTELLSMWRFRKYVVGLVFSVFIFAGVFCGGIYAMNVQYQRENIESPQFEISFPYKSIMDQTPQTTAADTSSGEPASETQSPQTDAEQTEPPPSEEAPGYTYDDIKNRLYDIDGVKYILKYRSIAATEVSSHILVDKDDLTFLGKISGVAVKDSRGYCNVDFALFDEEVAENLEYLGYQITGDIMSVVNGENVIAISDSFSNSTRFKLQVGDTIKIAVNKYPKGKLTSEPLYTYDQILKAYLDAYYFSYEEYTVGAIISGMPSDGTFPVYMNAEVFEHITDAEPFFPKIEIFCDDGLSEAGIQEVERTLHILSQVYDMDIKNTSQNVERMIDGLKNYPGIILYISLLLLFVSVLILMLSQSLFYIMRKQELDVYMCLGADFRVIRKLFVIDGAFFVGLAAVFYTVFAFVSSYAAYLIANSGILGTGSFRTYFDIPLWAFFAGLVVSCAASFITVVKSYLLYKRGSASVFTGKPEKRINPVTGSADNKSDIFEAEHL